MMPFQPQLAAQDEFQALTRRAALQSFFNRLLRKATQLCDFERERKKAGAGTFGRRTLTDICLGRVVGSAPRSRDYTPTFLPRRGSDEGRWVRVRQALEDEGLPPLEVYQIGEHYFVLDGHHRVSVMKRLNVPVTEAYVTQLVTTGASEPCAC